MSRDFAFIVDRSVKAADIVRAAQKRRQEADHRASTVFDVYEGKGIDPGKKSVAIAVTLQPREKTLTDQEIEAVATLRSHPHVPVCHADDSRWHNVSRGARPP